MTIANYKSCVSASACQRPKEISSFHRSTYYDNDQFANYPVVYVDWNMAKAYCEWRNARLPNEAEWEKAARGLNGRTYPWGEGIDVSFANYAPSMGDTTPVGSYEKGKSPYGVYDMAGNVSEWVSSLYKPYPYSSTDGREDTIISDRRSLRGGSWQHFSSDVRSADRDWDYQDGVSYNYGFRCARDVTP